MKPRPICFDLEGPLSPEDHAFELFKLIPEGDQVFSKISRYDDLLAITGRIGYEPGDTLTLILPFLFRHDIGLPAITSVSARCTLVSDADRLLDFCIEQGYVPYIVSTSYYPHAYAIAGRLKIPSRNVYATRLQPQMWRAQLPEATLTLIVEAEEYLRRLSSGGQYSTGDLDATLVNYLDNFYLNRLPLAGLQLIEDKSSVVGGRRKVWAVERIARRNRVYLKEVIFIGDSITDAAILQIIELSGGLAISFNGNNFAIPCATVAVASDSLLSLAPLLESWSAGGRAGVKEFVDQHATTARTSPADYIWKPGSNPELLQHTIARHAVTRQKVRQAAGSLG